MRFDGRWLAFAGTATLAALALTLVMHENADAQVVVRQDPMPARGAQAPPAEPGFQGGFGGGGFNGGQGGFNGPMRMTPPPSVAMLADGEFLFIVQGNRVFKLRKSNLTLAASADLAAGPHPPGGPFQPQNDRAPIGRPGDGFGHGG
jgi:hypothetical protein